MDKKTITLNHLGHGLYCGALSGHANVYMTHNEVSKLFDVPLGADTIEICFSRVVDAYEEEEDDSYWLYVTIGFPHYREVSALLVDNDITKTTEVATGFLIVAGWLQEQGYEPFRYFAMRVSYY